MSDRNELTHTCIFIPPTQAHLSLPTAIGQSSSCLQPSRPRPSNGYQSYPKCSPKRCPNQCKILLALLPLRMAARPSKVIRQPHECVASFLEHRLRYEDTWIISCQKKTDMDILPMLASENWMQVPCQTATNSHTHAYSFRPRKHIYPFLQPSANPLVASSHPVQGPQMVTSHTQNAHPKDVQINARSY